MRVARTAQFVEQFKQRSRLKLDQMSCWARYKYAEKEPAFRVHVWDIFDEALMATKTLDSFFDVMWDKLHEIYIEQGWDLEQKEV